MTFPVYGTVFIDGITPVPAAFLNQIRTEIADALDGNGGGSYSPIAQLIISGDFGLRLNATPLEGSMIPLSQFLVQGAGIGIDSKLDVRNGGLIRVLSGGEEIVEASGFLTVANGGVARVQVGGELNIAGDVTWLSAGSATFNDGSTFTYGSGGSVGKFTLTTVAGHARVDLEDNAFFHVNSGASFIVDSGGQSTVAGGANLNLASSSTADFRGAIEVHPAATIQVDNTASVSFQAGSILDLSGNAITGAGSAMTITGATWALTSGSVLKIGGSDLHFQSSATVSGDRTDSGDVTRTGSTTLTGSTTMSGDGAYVGVRITTLADANNNIHPERHDKHLLQSPAANRTMTLLQPPNDTPVSTRFTLVGSWSGAHAVTMNNWDATGIVAFNIGGGGAVVAAEFTYDGANWVITDLSYS